MKRRDFLKIGAVSAVYGAMGVSSLKADEASDYKAIVVLFHAGGNDSLNMFIPSGEDPQKGYPNYHNIRNNIRVEEKELTLPNSQELHLTPGNNPYDVRNDLTLAYTKGFYRHEGLDYATNGLMPELAHLINRGKVAIVANCGNLIEPVTKEQLLSKKSLDHRFFSPTTIRPNSPSTVKPPSSTIADGQDEYTIIGSDSTRIAYIR